MKAMATAAWRGKPDCSAIGFSRYRRRDCRVRCRRPSCNAIALTFLPQYPQLTPAMRSVLERMARAPYPPMYTLSPAEAKTNYELGAGVLEVPKAELVRIEDFSIAARDGHPLPAR